MAGLIAVFAPPLDVERDTPSERIVGSQLGGRDFVRAMLRYLPTRSVALVVPDNLVASGRRDLRRLSENEEGNFGSAEIVARTRLPELISQGAISVVHEVAGVELHKGAYLRSRFAHRPFPLTSFTHGLSPQPLFWSSFARLAITPTLPCDSVICSSRAARDALVKALDYVREDLGRSGVIVPRRPLRLDILPLGVDPELFCPGDKRAARYALGLPQSAIIILYFGRLDHVSKADLGPLILAFKRVVSRSHRDVFLVLAGGSPTETARNYLRTVVSESGCSDQVIIRASPRSIEAPLFYRAADLFVSPVDTLQESFGISPLEAMSSGLPAVVSGWSGYRETVLDGVTGYHVRCYWGECTREIEDMSPINEWALDHLLLAQSVVVDVDDLERSLHCLVQNHNLRERMATAARNHIIRNYSWQAVIQRAHDLWVELRTKAQQLGPESKIPYQLERPRYFEIFGHYPESVLAGNEVLAMTDSGRELCRRRALIYFPAGLECHLDASKLKFGLRTVRFLSRFGVRITIDELTGRISKHFRTTDQEALRHILWMLKHHHVTLCVDRKYES